MTSIPYVAAMFILSAVAYGIFFIFREGKKSELENEENNVIRIKTLQDKADVRPGLRPADIINRMHDDEL